MTTEVRIGIIGSVDSGKSTLTGVLTNGELDDGKGFARSSILKHPHEKESGRTSSINQYYIKNEDNSSTTLIDLAGHEKYFKTTITGLNRIVDYACLIVGCNMGVLRMTREHLITALSLDIPTFIVLTKFDIAPPNKYKETMKDIIKFIDKKTNKRRSIVHIKNEDELSTFLLSEFNKSIVPIFTVSSKTGLNIQLLKNYISQLKQRYNYNISLPTDFIVEHKYNLRGIGTVVSGVVKSGSIAINDVLLFGSFHRKFYEVKVKSIHNNFRENVERLDAGQGGCLNIKFMKEKFNHRKIKSGVHVIKNPQIYTTFKAKIKILQHPTTIKVGYEPTIHCESISQTATIINMDKTELRLGDTASVEMRFKYHPEFITLDSRIIFREGMTKGIGIITDIIE